MGKLKFFATVGGYLLRHIGDAKKMRKLRESGDEEARLAIMRATYDQAREILAEKVGTKVELHGLENVPDGPVLFVANHSGMFDALVMSAMPGPCGFVLKKEHQKIPLAATYLNEMNCVFIDRENPRAAAEAINKACEIIKQGHNMVIFPEGTRSRSSEVGEFKNGALRIAQKTKVPIVPVAIDRAYRLWEEKGTIVEGTVKANILPPVELKSMERSEYKSLGPKIREIIVEELARMAKE